MPIPNSHQIKYPLLKLYLDGKIHNRNEFKSNISNYFDLVEAEEKELTKSGRSRFDGQIGWAIWLLVNENLLEKCSVGRHKITNFGLELLSKNQITIEKIEDDLDMGLANYDNQDDLHSTLLLLENETTYRKNIILNKIIRNPRLAAYVKERAGFICQVCGRLPFLKSNGEKYAEADHIKPLGGNSFGSDSIDNLRCLCAQCHSIITYGSEEEINKILRINKDK